MNATPETRREMCRTTLRWVALGGIAVLSAGLIGRTARGRCSQSPSCRGCAALADCRLPQALDIKDHGED